jgi:hypothetical protein
MLFRPQNALARADQGPPKSFAKEEYFQPPLDILKVGGLKPALSEEIVAL